MNYLISDAAKQVNVEAHVLRYWEEELDLPIRRNEQGHRFYTEEDVERFREIKDMKERGFQLKAIRMVLKDGGQEIQPVTAEDKAKRLQWLLQQMFRETLEQNNHELCQMVKEQVLKELDYQFRLQEEKAEERCADQRKREEEHYRRIDELLGKKRRQLILKGKKEHTKKRLT